MMRTRRSKRWDGAGPLRPVLACVAAGLSTAALAAPATAAELVVVEPDGVPNEVVVEQGGTARFTLAVSAIGTLSCATRPDSGVGAVVPTAYAVGPDGSATSSAPSPFLRFYANLGKPTISPPLHCGVDWDGAPAPYSLTTASVTVSPTTPGGVYRLPLTPTLENPGFSSLGPLSNDSPDEIAVQVIAPLPPPKENESVNVFPGRSGVATVQPPGSPAPIPILTPLHVPVESVLDTTGGYVDLESDRDGQQNGQRAEFWAGVFKVSYSRQAVPGEPEEAEQPFTEVTLLDSKAACPKGARRGSSRTARHRRRARRLWGSGRGRFRTRGRHGAATIRATKWLMRTSCAGTSLFTQEGTVLFRDFSVRRTFKVTAGQTYVAAPRGVTDARG